MTTTRTRETRVRQVDGFTGATEWYEVVAVPGDERIGSYWRTGRAWAADHDASGRTSRHRTPEDARRMGGSPMVNCPHCHGTGYRHVWRTAERLSTHRERCRLCGGQGWYEVGGEG